MKILVVDDNTVNRKLLRAILATEGHSVVDAEDGQAALDVLEREPVDAVMSDILMPRMDGYRLCYEMRKNDKFKTLPFIACTATYDSPEDEKLALDFGADKFLSKLEAPDVIVKALNEVVERTRGRRATQIKEPEELLAMREYSETLVRKLEERNLELAEANQALRERALLAEFNTDISNALTHKGTLSEILKLCAEAVVRHLEAAFARIWTHNQATNFLDLQASAGMYTHIDGGHAHIPVGQYKIGLIASELKPHLTNAVIGDERVHDQEWAKREGMVAFAGYPLIVEDRLVGVMALFARRALNANTLLALESVANSISVGIQRKRAEEERERNLQRIRALHEIDKAISSTLDLQSVLDTLLEKIDVFFPYPTVTAVRLRNQQTGMLESIACRNLDENEWRNPIAATAPGRARRVMETRRPLTVLNVQTDPMTYNQALYRNHGLISYVGVPLIAKDEVLGVLNLYTKEEHDFSNEEIEFLVTLAAQAAIAIHNSQLHGQAQRNLERVRGLHEIDKAIISTLDFQSVLNVLLEKMDLVLPYAATTVRLFNPENGLLEPVACRNLEANEWKAQEWRGGRGLANIVFETKAPAIIRNAQVDPRVRDTEFYRKHKLVSYLGLPLIAKDKAFGVLGFYTKEEHEFSQEEIGFLNTLAGQAAIAIHNARLFEETKSQALDLERSNKVKDEFLSVISHELRTPLNVIMGYTTLLQDKTLGEVHPEQRDALGKIAHQSQSLLLLVDSILDVTLLESQREPLANNELNIEALLSELRADFAFPTQKKLDIVWDCAPDLPVIKADSKKLKHILRNLIHNAVKFTEEGKITISAKLRDQPASGAVLERRQSSVGERGNGNGAGEKWLEFKVADTGVGIPSEALSRIFDKFYQLDSSDTRSYGGVGLGLYIAKKFTELLGGTVEVQSEVGKGSTFTVRIPFHS